MPSPFKKSKSNEEDIKQQLHNTIYAKVTKENHKYVSPQKGDGTIKKCIESFTKEADPEVLTKLEKSLREQIELEKSPEKQEEYQKYYKYYIEDFLPALKTGVMELEVKFPVFNNKIEQSQGLKTQRGKILEIILDITNRSSDKDHSSSTSEGDEHESGYDSDTRDNDNTNQKDPIPHTAMENNKEENPTSPVSSGRSSLTSIASTSSEESLNSTLSSVEEDNGLQPEDGEKTELLESNLESPKENENRVQLEQAAKEEPKMQENENKAVLSKQEASNNENNGEDTPLEKQPNKRNLYVALAAGCALSTIGCIVAGAMTSGLVGAGLLAMAAVFAIATAVTWYLTPPSSELTSTNLSRPVDDKELTACSQR